MIKRRKKADIKKEGEREGERARKKRGRRKRSISRTNREEGGKKKGGERKYPKILKRSRWGERGGWNHGRTTERVGDRLGPAKVMGECGKENQGECGGN